MIKKSGFTLVEVLISLSIFIYIFSALMMLFFQFSKSINPTNKCSAFSIILIQKVLTESDSVQVASTSDEIFLGDNILHAESNALYLYKMIEQDNFIKNKEDFKFDSCDVSFSKNTNSTNPVFNTQKCINFQYKQAKIDVVCALK